MPFTIYALIAILLSSCASVSEWEHGSDFSAKAAYELLVHEAYRCFPNTTITKHNLDEIGEYQIKVYKQPLSLPNYRPVDVKIIYTFKIKRKDAGSTWHVASSRDKAFLDNFEKTKKLCD